MKFSGCFPTQPVLGGGQGVPHWAEQRLRVRRNQGSKRRDEDRHRLDGPKTTHDADCLSA